MLFKRKDGLKAIYTMYSIQSFGLALISVFIPIYLLTLGYSISQALIFFIVYYVIHAPGAFLAIWLAKKTSLSTTMTIIRLPLLFIFLFLLLFIDQHSISIYIIALIGGLQNIIFWIPLHLLFSHSAKKDKIGHSTGILFILPQVMGLISPLLGGLITVYLGFNFLFLIVILILIFSIFPLIGFKKVDIKFKFEAKEGVKLFKKYPKYFFVEIFENIGEETKSILWPLFVYVNVVNIAIVGVVATLSKFGGILFTFFVGKASDKMSKKKIIKIGAVLLALTWIARYFFISEAVFYITSVFIGFFMVMVLIPYTSMLYKETKTAHNADEFFVFREIPVMISRVLILSVALLFVDKLEFSFIIAGVSYLYFLFL